MRACASELPDTLVLGVTERRPVGVIDALGERGILASDATLLPMTAGAPEGLPAVRAGLGAPSEDQRRAAAALLAALDPVVMARVREVSVGQDGIVSLALASGTTVNAGEVGDEAAEGRGASRRPALGVLAEPRRDGDRCLSSNRTQCDALGRVDAHTRESSARLRKCHRHHERQGAKASVRRLTLQVATSTVTTLTEGRYDNNYLLDRYGCA